MTSPYLTAEETADLLRFASVRALYKAIPRIGIPFRRCGRRFLFDRSEIDRWLAGESGFALRRQARHRSA